MLYRYRISTKLPPSSARISVLVMVPTMSRPTFMPDRNKAPRPRVGSTQWTSQRAEDRLMATSMTAPRVLTMTPPTSRPFRPMGVPCWRSCSSGSTSVKRRPSILQMVWANRPKAMARAMPRTVPSMAQQVFLCTPPRIKKHATLTRAQTPNTVGITGRPLKSRGMSK